MTKVNAGTLVVSGSISGSLAVVVGDSASLSTPAFLRGSGTIPAMMAEGGGEAATSGAVVDPGNAAKAQAGILTLAGAGSLSITHGAHLAIQVGGMTAGGESTTGYDRVTTTTGNVTLTGGDLQLSLMGTPAMAGDALLFIIVNGGSNAVTGRIYDPQRRGL